MPKHYVLHMVLPYDSYDTEIFINIITYGSFFPAMVSLSYLRPQIVPSQPLISVILASWQKPISKLFLIRLKLFDRLGARILDI